MPPVRFEPTISAGERTATGTGSEIHIKYMNRLCGEEAEFLVLNLLVKKKVYH
jgi:hypothetical protein